jgi:NAD(P)-dependent dehydrogenase (short-subunit alcohol dehydrogenase family)
MQPVKNVLITGAAKRLGREIALTFARAGWGVAVHYGHSSVEAAQTVSDCQALGVATVGLQADLQDLNAVAQLVPKAIAALGGLHCLVNSASAFEPDEGINFTPDAFLRQQTVNVLVPLQLAQALALHSQHAQQVGCAVHILDQKVDNLNPDYFSYTVSKLALRDCVKLQAQSLAPHLRVLGVSPGLIYVSGPQSEANFKKAASVNLLKTPTDPANVARAIVDLVLNPAINGAIVNVDSGQHLVPLGRDIMFLVDEL